MVIVERPFHLEGNNENFEEIMKIVVETYFMVEASCRNSILSRADALSLTVLMAHGIISLPS